MTKMLCVEWMSLCHLTDLVDCLFIDFFIRVFKMFPNERLPLFFRDRTERVESVAFVARALAGDLHARLAARGQACTRLLVAAETEHGESHERLWRDEGALTVGGDAAMAGTLSAGQGAYSLPGANLVLTAGASGARYLTFTLSPAN